MPDATWETATVPCSTAGEALYLFQVMMPKTMVNTTITVTPASESELVNRARPPKTWRRFFVFSSSRRSTRMAKPSGGPTMGASLNSAATCRIDSHSARQVWQVSRCCFSRLRSPSSSNPSSASDIRAVIRSPCSHSISSPIVFPSTPDSGRLQSLGHHAACPVQP